MNRTVVVPMDGPRLGALTDVVANKLSLAMTARAQQVLSVKPSDDNEGKEDDEEEFFFLR